MGPIPVLKYYAVVLHIQLQIFVTDEAAVSYFILL